MSHEAVMAEIVPNSEPDLPMGWVRTTLGEIAHINRRGTAPRELPDNLLVSFVPMAAVDAERGTIAWQEERPLSEVRKGFTSFSDGDVLFAKITPCMENGKAAVANGLKNGRGFGSTEFHVLTPRDGVASKWIFYFVRQQSVREDAKARFTGTAGQLRVPGSFLVNYPIALAPSAEQQRIVTAIEQYFSRLDAGVATLKVVQAKLKRYRAAVLKAAVEGTLSEAWRAQHPDVEPAPVLLQRILQERRSAWEQAELARFAKAGKAPSKGWHAKYRVPVAPYTTNLPRLPTSWCWATMEQLTEIQGGIQKQPSRAPKKNAFPYLRVANVLRGRLDLSEVHRIELYGNELENMRLQRGDLLIVEGNGSRAEIGRSALWTGEIADCVHQNHIIRARLHEGDPRYLDHYWNSPDGNGRVIEVAASTSGLYTLSVSKITKLPVPLPPLAEQEQIVAEVERRLSVAAETEAQVEADLKRAERLRQSILKQAFAGKLVPQDPEDEPASVLLERIRGQRRAGADTGQPDKAEQLRLV